MKLWFYYDSVMNRYSCWPIFCYHTNIYFCWPKEKVSERFCKLYHSNRITYLFCLLNMYSHQQVFYYILPWCCILIAWCIQRMELNLGQWQEIS